MKPCILFALLLLLLAQKSNAQMNEEDVAIIGVRGGYVYASTLLHLRNVLVSQELNPIVSQYTVDLPRSGYFASVFGHQRVKSWPLIVQSEFSIAQLGGRVEYSVPDTVFWQKSDFRYLSFSPALMANFHPFLPDNPQNATALSGIHIGVGGSYNLIVREHIRSIYWDASQNQDQDNGLTTNIKAQSHLALLLAGGYEYFWNGSKSGSGFGITVEFRAGLGLSDAVKSYAVINPDQKVKMKYFMLTGGIMFPLKH